MSSTGRIIELSLASAIGPEQLQKREDELTALPNFFKRFGAQALHEVVKRKPVLAENVLQRAAKANGLEYLGFGATLSVYADTEKVIKVHRDSANLNLEHQERLATGLRNGYRLSDAWLGHFMLEEEVVIAPHPLGGPSTVQVHQPRVNFDPKVELFTMNTPFANPTAVEEALKQQPGIDDAFYEFIGQARNMMDKTRFLPDTNGKNNLVVASSGTSPALIDSQPIGPEYAAVQSFVMSQLDSLEVSLAEVA